MKKLLWVLAAVAISFSTTLFYSPPTNKVQAADYTQLKKKKKKTKHNYRSLTATTVSGDETNADAGIIPSSSTTYQTNLYRKVAVPGLSLSDPFPLRISSKTTPVIGFEEEHWGSASNYIISEGNVWITYGNQTVWGGNTTNNILYTGDYRIFNYFGGTRKKAAKKQAVKIYNYSITGDANNSDLTAQPNSIPASTYCYRKVAVPELKMANLGDYRIYRKNSFYQGFSEESWTPVNSGYLITDGYLYFPYGYKTDNYFYSSNQGDYRIYLYSDGKTKKKKLTKQYFKRYTLNVPGGGSTADKVTSTTTGSLTTSYYYKKFALPGLKMADRYSLRVVKKNSFNSGFSDESWSDGLYYVVDGYIWIYYGIRTGTTGGSTGYYDVGAGDYQVFLYK